MSLILLLLFQSVLMPPRISLENPAEAKDPVCGMMVEISHAEFTVEHNEKTYYFCCDGCQKSFQKNPGHYLGTSDTGMSLKDPVCGMTVDADSAEHHSEFQNETFYFCCIGCKRLFEKNPKKYVAAIAAD